MKGLAVFLFLAGVVSLLVFLWRWFRKKDKKIFGIAGIVAIVLSVVLMPPPTPEEKAAMEAKQAQEAQEKANKAKAEQEPKEKADNNTETNSSPAEGKVEKNYDTLQTIFTQINTTTKPSDIDSVIANNNLAFTKQEYNGTPKNITYKIAYDKDVALQKYGKSGDYVSISFNANDGSVMTVEYHKNLTTALLYNYGIHWDFREKSPNNQYSGYYYQLDSTQTDGIEIKYSNGNTKKTSYHRVDSADSALSSIL
ncbi:MAG: hypothetical protein E7203_06970 [Selenomonas ruminantium]|jgi:hypothetical protein|uniref:Uncharacterized protein n=1 Tax=Selenomonas ruminantium TaxID=971 RepID=A0A927WJK3_SELRU|nr:hypothetical protein [Selenomonas ruminantium]MBE6085189.1 hypothetical protein [Selenomonas ruminantium]